MNELLRRDVDLIRLAREIAIDHWDIDTILDRYQLGYDQWCWLCDFPRFTQLLANEEEAWKAAKNTRERVKLKSAAVIETYLEDAAKSLLSEKETLVAKTGLAKLIASFAGIGTEYDQKHGVGGGSGFSITINLGDRTLEINTNRGVSGELEGENTQNYDENKQNYDENNMISPDFPALEGVEIDENVYAINADLS